MLHPDERSPCLLQFLEAVHHCREQLPDAFEYNDVLLQALAVACESGWYADFLENSEKERAALGGQVRKTLSWPRSWANSSLLDLYSRTNVWANLHRLGQPDTFFARRPSSSSGSASAG